MLGNFTGIIGASHTPARDALLAWVSMINDTGGINGRPLDLSIADNGGDYARNLPLARSLIEDEGVIAIVNPFDLTTREVGDYAHSQGVPLVGGANNFAWMWEVPGTFPVSASPANFYFGLAKTAAEAGVRKTSILYCAESATCRDLAEETAGYFREVGVEVVYSAAVSLAQPDYTAECLNARTAGAEAVMPFLDGPSANRIAQSCGRQDFYPSFVMFLPEPTVVPEMRNAIGMLPNFPWMLGPETPALQEFVDAMNTYQPDASTGALTGVGWASGKLLERALRSISTAPTSQNLLEALWAIQGDTLDGLAPSLSFARDQPPPQAQCGFFVTVQNGEWVAPNGLQLSGCRS